MELLFLVCTLPAVGAVAVAAEEVHKQTLMVVPEAHLAQVLLLAVLAVLVVPGVDQRAVMLLVPLLLVLLQQLRGGVGRQQIQTLVALLVEEQLVLLGVMEVLVV